MSVPVQSKGTVFLLHNQEKRLLTGDEDLGWGGIANVKCHKMSFGENYETKSDYLAKYKLLHIN